MSLDTAQFCYIRYKIGWVSALLYYHITSHQANSSTAGPNKRFLFISTSFNGSRFCSIWVRFPPREITTCCLSQQFLLIVLESCFQCSIKPRGTIRIRFNGPKCHILFPSDIFCYFLCAHLIELKRILAGQFPQRLVLKSTKGYFTQYGTVC